MKDFDLLNLLTNNELGLPAYSGRDARHGHVMRYNLDAHSEMKEILLERMKTLSNL